MILALVLLSCNKENPTDAVNQIKISGLTPENYPAIDGSTSTEPLHAVLACRLFGIPFHWVYIDPLFQEYPFHIVPDADENSGMAVTISRWTYHSGTHSSFMNLIFGNKDLILVARTISPDEKHIADSLGVTLLEVPIALDAFVFLCNSGNPVESVTTEQIREIYTGSLSNWKTLGGEDKEISPYRRDANSGSEELMISLVMKDIEMPYWPDMIAFGMLGLVNRIEYDTLGLGYSVYYYTKYMIRSEKVKMMKVDGVFPDFNTLRNLQYPYTAEVYAVIRDDLDTTTNAYKIFNLLQTQAGQNLVEESGYIPVN